MVPGKQDGPIRTALHQDVGAASPAEDGRAGDNEGMQPRLKTRCGPRPHLHPGSAIVREGVSVRHDTTIREEYKLESMADCPCTMESIRAASCHAPKIPHTF
mmetsp:Transcript_114407/g.323419  ORF Transcript_114407/g.323419 Transcript_114407/m.323419 type:complete len:102 (-) Transcript_114407:376-681(-)